MSRLFLVRHGEVDRRWCGVCYGRSDAELSADGRRQSQDLADELAGHALDLVLHSGRARTLLLAELLAARTSAACVAEPALRERDFGTWEGRSWDSIHAETGSAMDGMILAPDRFRPPGGETTF